ncbi:hypothetical protein LCGC14_2923820, partial [marine sediment metagenome]
LTTIPYGSDYMSITPRNLSGAAVAKYSLNPFLTIFWTDTSGNSVTDISDEMQDGDSTDSAIDDLPTLANGGAMYVGALEQFRGVAVEVGADPNSQANNLTVNYWNGAAWTDASDTDTTDTGASFAVDGTVLWAIPGSWVRASLSAIGSFLGSGFEFDLPKDAPERGTNMYWTRWEWSDVMDTSTDIIQMLSLNRSTAPAEYLEGQTVEFMLGRREIGNVQGSTNAGTSNLLINVGTLVGNRFE